ncbi:MAG TPA: acetolactate synthase large subunit [Candidatus Paceibacterota bacterium]|nr:acetolactate synthase large subunit [Candidatus Paceibacterota bacterium]
MSKEPKSHSVAEDIVRTLEARGVKYIFGVPGEEIEELLFAISKSRIQFIATRHEQGAAFMADVWGRLTGKAGVCVATLGPGATNLLTGLADAGLDKSPVLAITGQADTKRHHNDSHQYIHTENIFKPISKWNTTIVSPRNIGYITAKALLIAEDEKPGITHIDLPEDIAEMHSKGEFAKTERIKKVSSLKETDIKKALKLLKNAKYPLIFSGNGVVRKNGHKILGKIALKFNIPVVTTFMGKGAISDDFSLSLKTIGLKARDLQMQAFEKTDLVIAVGVDHGEYSPNNWAKNKRIIHIDYEKVAHYPLYKPQVSLIGDIEKSLNTLFLSMKKQSKFESWYMPLREMIEEEHSKDAEGITLTVPFLLQKLKEAMRPEDIIISDVGAHKMWIGRNFKCLKPNTCIISNNFASMGIALPGGIGAKLAKPNVRVVSVMGDGGFLMNSQEIETAKRIGVPYVIVVLNDNDYGLINWKQTAARGKSFGTRLSNPNFVKYAESFGIKAYKIRKREEAFNVFKKAIDSNTLCLVTIDIDASANLKLTSRMKDFKNIFNP